MGRLVAESSGDFEDPSIGWKTKRFFGRRRLGRPLSGETQAQGSRLPSSLLASATLIQLTVSEIFRECYFHVRFLLSAFLVGFGLAPSIL